tara:strand:+ start:199 stop:1137 length:939 start_codon:yes stop_codon:yes gene_type:complete
MIILYGNENYRVDITDVVMSQYVVNRHVCIPNDDHARADMFGDPAFGEVKFIKIFDDMLNSKKFQGNEMVYLPVDCNFETYDFKNHENAQKEIDDIISTHKFPHNVEWVKNNPNDYNSDETFEQYMTYRFLPREASVLELGGNIGRNSMLISSILTKPEKHVVLESYSEIADCLKKNRDENSKRFHVEDAALSKRKLLQKENSWTTIPSDRLIEGYKKVRNVTKSDLEQKYDIKFDALVADCEGALYEILQDDSSVLDNIKTVIVENDYFNEEKLRFVNDQYSQKGFKRVYVARHPQVSMPPNQYFFEVWMR